MKRCILLPPLLMFLTISAIAQTYSIPFYYQLGGQVPSPDQESIVSQIPTVPVTNMYVQTSGQSWLSASLSSTMTPATLYIAVNPVGLPVGTVNGTVLLICSANTLTYNVSLTVTPAAPTINLSASTITFTAIQGQNAPPPQNLLLSSSVAGTTAFSFSTLPNWLCLNSFCSSMVIPVQMPATLPVSVNPVGLPLGTYTTSIQFYTIQAPNTYVTVTITLNVITPPPQLQVNTSQLQFQYLIGAAAPANQSVQVTSSGAPMQAIVSSAAVASWLTVSPTSGTTPFSVVVGVNASTLAVGTYSAQINLNTNSSTNPSTQTVSVTLVVSPDLRPKITSTVNGASFDSGVGPGSWITINGTSLAGTTAQASAPFGSSLDGVSAQLSGVGGAYSLLIYYVSPNQINAFVPLEMTPSMYGTSCSIAVTTNNGTSSSYTSSCSSLTPALFWYGAQHYASATHLDNTVLGRIPGTTPALTGSIITLWGTGFGQTIPAMTTASINAHPTAAVLATPVVVLVNNQPCQVLWAGMVSLGLYQFNIQLPSGLLGGDYPVVVQIGGIQTDSSVMIPIL